MIWANDKEGNKIEAEPYQTGYCRLCNEKLIPKCGEIKRWHWSHKGNTFCDLMKEPETLWHIDWKSNYPKECQEVIIEKDGDKHIADVKTKQLNKVIEFQNSSISSGNIRKREIFYQNMIWVINGATIGKNIQIRKKGNYFTFRWKQPPKSWWVSKKPVYVDLSGIVEKMKSKVDEYIKGISIHQSPVYEQIEYEYYTPEAEHIEVSYPKIIDYEDDTEREISRLKNKISLLRGNLFQIKKMYKKIPCAGWGLLIDKNKFLQCF